MRSELDVRTLLVKKPPFGAWNRSSALYTAFNLVPQCKDGLILHPSGFAPASGASASNRLAMCQMSLAVGENALPCTKVYLRIISALPSDDVSGGSVFLLDSVEKQ